jgi:hypothetical protein
MWRRLLLSCIVLNCLALPAEAGIFRRGPKPDPAQRVPELLKILKEDADDRKRADAAEELREYDSRTFPDLMPALIDALQNDPSTSVRAQAANSIGRLRPISQQAGFALEQALQHDSSWRVRVAARTTLWEYHLLGYRSGRPAEKALEQTDEPPLADPPTNSAPMSSKVAETETPKRSIPIIDKPLLNRPLFPLLRRDPPRTPATGDPGTSPAPPPVTSSAIERLPPSRNTTPPPAVEGPALGPSN